MGRRQRLERVIICVQVVRLGRDPGHQVCSSLLSCVRDTLSTPEVYLKAQVDVVIVARLSLDTLNCRNHGWVVEVDRGR